MNAGQGLTLLVIASFPVTIVVTVAIYAIAALLERRKS